MKTFSWLWAAYFVAVFSVGRLGGYERLVIWLGGAVVGGATLLTVIRRLQVIPSEVLLLLGFATWALAGGFLVEDWPAYLDYVKLMVELLLVVALLGAVLRLAGLLAPFWWAFLFTGVINTITVLLNSSTGLVFTPGGPITQAQGLVDNPNGFGFLCFLGILGALGILGDTKSTGTRVVAVVGALVALWGLLVSASRGALVCLVLALVLWPLLCMGFGRRRRRTTMILMLAVGVGLYFGLAWILENTYLGLRVENTPLFEGKRWLLIVEGFKVFGERPVLGAGLGQFGIATGIGTYAHTELVELLATTGIPGFLFMASVYWICWRRLTRALRDIVDPIVRYHVNFVRMTVLIVVIAGIVVRPLFMHVDAMFLLALIVGMSWWAKDQAKTAAEASRSTPSDSVASLSPPGMPSYPSRLSPPARSS